MAMDLAKVPEKDLDLDPVKALDLALAMDSTDQVSTAQKDRLLHVGHFALLAV